MLRRNTFPALQGARLPHAVTGANATNLEADVVAIHKDTLDARCVAGRSTKINVRFPLWYTPAIGDRVVISEINGDERLPFVVTPLRTKTNSAPAVG